MAIALARGDVDAYVGAEPGPGISVSSGIGKIVEYPYSTPMGSLNMIFGTHAETVARSPDLVRQHAAGPPPGQRVRHGQPRRHDRDDGAKLGMKREALEVSLPNVELTGS